MKVKLIHPPQPSSIDDRLNPPMNLLYVAGYIREYGYSDVEVVDLSEISKDQWTGMIGYANVYGITMYTSSYSICLEIARICKEINPLSIFIVGGPHPTALPSSIVDRNIDLVVVGEGEYTMKKILDMYPEYPDRIILQDVPVDTTTLPLPALDLVDWNSYDRSLDGTRAPQIYTYRNCAFHCTYCYRGPFNKLSFYPIDHITGILDYYDSIGLGSKLVIWDSFFTNRRSRWYQIANILKERGISYRCNGKIGVDSKADMEKLVDTGCTLFNIGLESGSQRIIDLMDKRFTMDQAKEYISNVKSLGLTHRTFLQFAFPGETEESILETRRFIEESDIDQFSCFTHNPFPGADTFRNPLKYGIRWLSSNWDDYYTVAGTDGMGGMPFETIYLSRERAIELNKEFIQYLRSREWRGPKEEYHRRLGI